MLATTHNLWYVGEFHQPKNMACPAISNTTLVFYEAQTCTRDMDVTQTWVTKKILESKIQEHGREYFILYIDKFIIKYKISTNKLLS